MVSFSFSSCLLCKAESQSCDQRWCDIISKLLKSHWFPRCLAGISGTGGQKRQNRKCTEDNRGWRLEKCAESCIPTLPVDVHSHWRTERLIHMGWTGPSRWKQRRRGEEVEASVDRVLSSCVIWPPGIPGTPEPAHSRTCTAPADNSKVTSVSLATFRLYSNYILWCILFL